MVIALQEQQLAEHGGQSGLRDEVLLRSTLDRPKTLFAYAEPDLFDLAASYAYAMAKTHPFLDGNKRASLVSSETFLSINGIEVTAAEITKVGLWLSLADGSMSEAELAAWFRVNANDTRSCIASDGRFTFRLRSLDASCPTWCADLSRRMNQPSGSDHWKRRTRSASPQEPLPLRQGRHGRRR